MALHHEISNEALQKCISNISSNYFTTLKVVDELSKQYPESVDKVKSFSERNWRAVIGKAVKRFSVETIRIKQISPSDESPARWEKISV